MIFENAWVKIWFDGNIMYYKYKSGSEIDVDLTENLLCEIEKLNPYTKKSLVIIEEGFNFTDGSLHKMAREKERLIKMFDTVAVVTHYHTFTIRIINFFLKFSKSINFKIFNDINQAKKWIEK